MLHRRALLAGAVIAALALAAILGVAFAQSGISSRTLTGNETQLGDGSGAVLQQLFLVRWIDSRACDHLGAVARADVLLVGLHDRVDGVTRDETLFHQE